jgi:trans-2,3-dihydro-3-hydroxyanthranilate isomerase
MARPFYITDVFAEGPYAGNQLATLFDAAGLAAAEMQKIAREFNFAETTFVMGGDAEQGFDVRIFTPAEELPFAGHPTLGTAFLLRELVTGSGQQTLCLNLPVGKIQVSFAEDGIVWMTQQQPIFGETLAHGVIAAELGLVEDQLDQQFPVQLVSTGLEFLLVPVRHLADLQAIVPRADASHRAILAFCVGGYEPDQAIAARMFAPGLGVVEDAATGSANGCLAAYLVAHGYLGSATIDLRVGQGYEIGRPSQLSLKAHKMGSHFTIKVGGRVRLVARGEFL